eukprot:9225114-Lingulodinium_polyedra.AAC.1
MDASHAEVRSASLFDALVAVWPQRFMTDEFAHVARGKVWHALRQVGYRMVFAKQEPRQKTIA